MQAFRDVAMVVSWLVGVALTAYIALAWSYQPGEGQSRLAAPIEGHGLRAAMLVHPDCPCTQASLHLLQSALNTSKVKVDTLIVVPGPKRNSPNIALAAKLPNARIQFLPAGEIAKRFGISTSGHLLIWRDDRQVFSGGITDARGEEAPGGAFAQLNMVLNSSKTGADMPVFGCLAYNREDAKQ